MSEAEQKDTEQKILEAAKEVFISEGMNGARMQQIADKAGINKALLHYYFRSKQKLFEAVFQTTFRDFFPALMNSVGSTKNVVEQIRFFIDQYIDLLDNNPYIPIFILSELSRNPERLKSWAGHLREAVAAPFLQQIKTAIDRGQIRAQSPEHLVVNIASLCVFPYAARPIIETTVFANNPEVLSRFYRNRKTEIIEFVLNAIKV